MKKRLQLTALTDTDETASDTEIRRSSFYHFSFLFLPPLFFSFHFFVIFILASVRSLVPRMDAGSSKRFVPKHERGKTHRYRAYRAWWWRKNGIPRTLCATNFRLPLDRPPPAVSSSRSIDRLYSSSYCRETAAPGSFSSPTTFMNRYHISSIHHIYIHICIHAYTSQNIRRMKII